MVESAFSRDMKQWLQDKPIDWAQIIAVRAAMRVLPYMGGASRDWIAPNAVVPFRALALSWAARNLPTLDMHRATEAAAQVAWDIADGEAATAAYAPADAAYDAALAAHSSKSEAIESAARTSDAYAGYERNRPASARAANVSKESLWTAARADYSLLLQLTDDLTAAQYLSTTPLWHKTPPTSFRLAWKGLKRQLTDIDVNYGVWVEWFERRLAGAVAGFDISGDTNRQEDQQIFLRLAEATDEDFWSKGAVHVNTELRRWLDEARERATKDMRPEQDAPDNESRPFIEVPTPIFGARAFGLNSEGKLDPLPPYNQQFLRDIPNQRRAYVDVRSAALELQEQGQRLGPKLSPKIARFVTAFPERFEDAEAWPIWSAAAALRTLYWKHKAVAQFPEPDDAKLESGVAMDLRGFLDIYNVFAFGDDGLRQKDEYSISPQERLKAEELARLSQPVGQAIIDTTSIRTEITLNEIKENLDNVLLAVGTPYADQTFDQANKITQNLAVGIFDGARDVLTDPRAIGTELAKLGIKVSATSAVGAVSYAVYNYIPLVEFIATNAEPLKAYVMTAFQSYPHLTEMIDRISLLWRRLDGTK